MSSIKFTGMSSGLDTDAIVKAMLTTEQLKVDSQTQKSTKLTWQKEAEKEISDKVYNFYTKYASSLRLQSTFNAMKVSAESSSAIQITGNGAGAPEGSHSIKVNQVASGYTVPSKVLKYQDSETGKTVVASGNTKLTDLGLNAGEKFTIKAGDKEVSFEIKGGDQTIDELTNEIKKSFEGTDVNFKFDAVNGAFIISSKTTGANQALEMSSASGVLGKLGLNPNAEGNYSFSGKDAIIEYNGGLTIESSSNSISVNGISFTAISVTTEPVSVSVSKNTDTVVDFVKEFVTEYNSLINEINSLVSTPPSKSYLPLTDAQKEAMTEDQIEKWENQAKEGILYNNKTLKDLNSTMRSILSSVVEDNEFGSLSKIGINTGSWSEKGKLTINETKLREAISSNPEDVMKLFTSSETGAKKGIGQKLYDTLKERFTSSKLKSNGHLFNDKLLDSNIKSASTRLSELQDKYTRMEELYYARFTAMEKALATLNSQSSALTSFFSG